MSNKSALIEVVNYKYDFDPNFDVDDNEAVTEMVKSKSWSAFRQMILHTSTEDTKRYPGKKIATFHPLTFASSLAFAEFVINFAKSTPDNVEQYWGEEDQLDSYKKLAEDIKQLHEPVKKKREYFEEKLGHEDGRLKKEYENIPLENEKDVLETLNFLKSELLGKTVISGGDLEEGEVLDKEFLSNLPPSEIFKLRIKDELLNDSIKEAKDRLKAFEDGLNKKQKKTQEWKGELNSIAIEMYEYEASLLEKVELMIFRSRLSENFKQKIIDSLPSALSWDR